MGRKQTKATKDKLRRSAQARKRAGGKFEKSSDSARPFARYHNTGGVLRDTKIGKHTVRYWPPGCTKGVPPEGEKDADKIKQLERVERAD